nr:MAG TPA: Major capsid protein [Caudoviricetes sp.]DAW69838.1 MAG TPA: Major capsid protein [Caudoviricetes sp.]
MSLDNFIPELWSASILENFHNDAVLVGMANRQYESAFTAGSKIHIPGVVDVKVKDYKTGAVTGTGGAKVPRTTVPDVLESTGIELVIDQEKSFDFLVDDIDRAQVNQSLDTYTKSAATGLVEDAETFLTAMLTSKGTAATGITNPTDWASAYTAILKLRGKLSAAKVPAMDRTLLINAAFEEFLLSDGSKLTSFDKSNMMEGLREATIGRLLGFDVVTSPWLDNTKPMAIGFYKPAIAYVSQVEKTESMRAENTFADRVRGLHVYGGAVLRPTAVQVFKAA